VHRVQPGDVADQLQGGARPVDGDEQVAPVRVGDLGDGLAEYADVVGGGVGASVARAQPQGQGLTGVVAPRAERVVAIGALVLCTRP
jgi:hypothetical protein